MRWLATGLFSLYPTAALAATGSFDPLRASLQMIAALAVVLGIVLLLFYLVRKRKLGPFAQGRGSAIQVLETRHLGPRKALCLVRVRGEDLLLSVCQDRIELLARPVAREPEAFAARLDAAREDKR